MLLMLTWMLLLLLVMVMLRLLLMLLLRVVGISVLVVVSPHGAAAWKKSIGLLGLANGRTLKLRLLSHKTTITTATFCIGIRLAH